MSTIVINELGPQILQISDVMQHLCTTLRVYFPQRKLCVWSRVSVIGIATRSGQDVSLFEDPVGARDVPFCVPV
jgi:hypothetical protein